MLVACELSFVAQMIAHGLQRLRLTCDPSKDVPMVRPSHRLDGIDQELRRAGQSALAMQPVDCDPARGDQLNFFTRVDNFDEDFTTAPGECLGRVGRPCRRWRRSSR